MLQIIINIFTNVDVASLLAELVERERKKNFAKYWEWTTKMYLLLLNLGGDT